MKTRLHPWKQGIGILSAIWVLETVYSLSKLRPEPARIISFKTGLDFWLISILTNRVERRKGSEGCLNINITYAPLGTKERFRHKYCHAPLAGPVVGSKRGNSRNENAQVVAREIESIFHRDRQIYFPSSKCYLLEAMMSGVIEYRPKIRITRSEPSSKPRRPTLS
jgi:hypothetical protein